MPLKKKHPSPNALGINNQVSSRSKRGNVFLQRRCEQRWKEVSQRDIKPLSQKRNLYYTDAQEKTLVLMLVRLSLNAKKPYTFLTTLTSLMMQVLHLNRENIRCKLLCI